MAKESIVRPKRENCSKSSYKYQILLSLAKQAKHKKAAFFNQRSLASYNICADIEVSICSIIQHFGTSAAF